MTIAILMVALFVTVAAADAQTADSCAVSGQPPSWLFGRYRVMATVEDPDDPYHELDSLRNEMGIPRLDSTAVYLVTDPAICSAALNAYRAQTGLQQFGDSVIVIALGSTRYVVTHALPFPFDHTQRKILGFDSTFTVVHFTHYY